MKTKNFDEFSVVRSRGFAMLTGAVSGGIGAELGGGNFWMGAGQGLIVTAFNFLAHKSDTSSQTQKSSDYLVYDGDEIIWYDTSGTIIERFPATSGLPGYQNSSYQNTPDAGPVPQGTYSVNLSLDSSRTANINSTTGETTPGNGIEKIPSTFTTNSGKTYSYPGWGTVRARLNPIKGTNTYGRSSFYLHDSHKGYSHGCIEVGRGFFPKLIQYSKSHLSISVIVRYSSQNTSTLGKTFY